MTIREFGFDYGVRPRMILVSDMSFIDYFDKGQSVAIVYIRCTDDNGNTIITELGFQFEVEEFAEKFMDSLMRWVVESGDDGDAVDLEFIEKLDGDYILGISANVDRFLKRMIPPVMTDRVDPIFTMAIKGKGGLRMSENYQLFKKQYVSGRKIPIRVFIGKEGKIEKVINRYFIKTEFKFSKEGELTKESMGHGLLAKENKSFNPKNLKRKRDVDIAKIDKRRVDELHYFYPILMDKLEREGWLSTLTESMPGHISKTETLQAIANIVLTERLKLDKESEVQTTGPGHDFNLFQYLLKTIESFDSYFPPDDFFTKGLVKKQARLDKQYLIEYLKKI